MPERLKRVGVREFRQGLAEYLGSEVPVAVTRHGQTVGYFVPARQAPEEGEVLALRDAVDQLEALMTKHGVSQEDVIRDFRARRSSR